MVKVTRFQHRPRIFNMGMADFLLYFSVYIKKIVFVLLFVGFSFAVVAACCCKTRCHHVALTFLQLMW